MVNKHHEYILRAFLEVRVPETIRTKAPSVMVTDSVIEDCCVRLLRRERRFNVPDILRVCGDDRDKIIGLLSGINEAEHDEIMDYYRLFMLTLSVLKQYRFE